MLSAQSLRSGTAGRGRLSGLRRRRRWPAVGVFAAGCVHPPKDEPPKTVTPAAYKEQGADLLQPAQPSDHAPRPAWWETFSDPKLNELETRLMTSNPTLAQAVARYAQARRAHPAESLAVLSARWACRRRRSRGRPSSAQGGHDEREDRHRLHPQRATLPGSWTSGAAFGRRSSVSRRQRAGQRRRSRRRSS